MGIADAPLLLSMRFPGGGLNGMFPAITVFHQDPATPCDDNCDPDRRVQGSIRSSDGAESRLLPPRQSCALRRTP